MNQRAIDTIRWTVDGARRQTLKVRLGRPAVRCLRGQVCLIALAISACSNDAANSANKMDSAVSKVGVTLWDSAQIRASGNVFCGDVGELTPCLGRLMKLADGTATANDQAEELWRVAVGIAGVVGSGPKSFVKRCAEPACAPSGKSTKVRIRVIQDSYTFLPFFIRHPTVLAIFQHEGADANTEQYYGVGPQKADEYDALVVYPPPPDVRLGPAEWRVFRVAKAANTFQLREVAYGNQFVPCMTPHTSASATGNFDGCEGKSMKFSRIESERRNFEQKLGQWSQLANTQEANSLFNATDPHVVLVGLMDLLGDSDPRWSASYGSSAWHTCGLKCCAPKKQ